MITGNDMLNHLAITVSNTSANLSCGSTSKKREAPSGCESACHGHVHTQNTEGETEIKKHSTNFGYVCICVCVVHAFMYQNKKVSLMHTYLSQLYICYMSTCPQCNHEEIFLNLIHWYLRNILDPVLPVGLKGYKGKPAEKPTTQSFGSSEGIISFRCLKAHGLAGEPPRWRKHPRRPAYKEHWPFEASPQHISNSWIYPTCT